MSEFGFAGDGIMDGMLEGQTPEGQGRSPVQSSPYAPQQKQKKGAPAPTFKFMDIFKGWKMTVNGITALFFIGYALWLVVLYFIRHNEPLANQVIGTPNAGAPTSDYDRILVGGAKFALPIQATGTHGFYTPGAKQYAHAQAQAHAKANAPVNHTMPAMGDPASFSAQSEMAFSNGHAPQTMVGSGSAAYGYKPIATPGGSNHSKTIHYGRERVIIHHPEPLPGERPEDHAKHAADYVPPNMVQHAPANFGSPNPTIYPQHNATAAGSAYPNIGGPNFNVPVQTKDGLRLRTFTNR
ncbi:MAG: hypothetical protein SGJ27_10740 [Candidatus Melainabacteria bacterium]|nr:hypothetical protein [Candidatus Melainabacteria bacterium]